MRPSRTRYVKIDGQVQVQGDANIQNFVDIKHAAFIQGDCHVRNFAKINGGAEVWGDAFVHDHAVVRTLNCHGRAHISSGAASGSTYSNMSIDGVFGMHIGRTYHNAQSNPPPPPFASRSTTRMSPYSSPTSEAPAAATGTPEHVNITRGTTIIGRGPDGVTVVCGTMDGHRMEGTVVSDNSTVTFGDFRGSREDGPFG